ncbi:MAG TPA: ATP-binding protein [Terriglobales bacterium]|nr:ATP-binding protein [Terriglobales bacterium]
MWRKSPFSPEENLRTERWLATARVFLAFSALIALWLDPVQVRSGWAYGLLGLYIAHGAAIMFLLRHPQQSTTGFRVLVHCVDVLLPALLTPFTTGTSNPFFLFFVFVLAAAAYRWGLWETLMTAVGSLSLLWMESLSFEEGILRAMNAWAGENRMPQIRADALGIAPKRLFMESVYLIVMALLLGYLAERQKKLRAERDVAAKMLSLVRMDVGLTGTLSQIVGEFLRLYGAKRALLAAQEGGGHRVVLGVLELGSSLPDLQWMDSGHSAFEDYLWQSSATAWYARKQTVPNDFRITGLDSTGNVVRDVDLNGFRRVANQYPFQALAAASFSFSQELSGRIFLFEPEFTSGTEEELRFFEDVVRQITPAIYNLYLLRRLRSRAGAAERARLVRELHDGAVQSLIGVEMQVDVLRRHSPGTESITAELERIQGLLREEVLKLRELMQEMKSTEVDARKLPGFLRDTVQRFQRETGIAAQFVMDADEIVLPQTVCRELARIAQEALVNVRKHSGAKRVTVQLSRDGQKLHLVVEDNGSGFPFSGRIAQAELDLTGRTPAVIRERVRLIQGELAIESKPGKGARVEVSVAEVQTVQANGNSQLLFR